MLTNIEYVGRPGMDRGYAATICEKHNYRDTAPYVYQLEEYECPTCVAIADREYREQQERAWMRAEAAAWRGHPSICMCNACYDWESENEFYRMLEEEAARLSVAEIFSPNYCDHRTSPIFGCCTRSDCQHPGCLEQQNAEPPF